MDLLRQCHGTLVLVAGFLERVDNAAAFGESGLSPVGGLGEDGEGRERQQEERGEILHDFSYLLSSVGFGWSICVGG